MVCSAGEASLAVKAHLVLEHARIATFLSDADSFKEGTTEDIFFINYHIILPIFLSLVALSETFHAEVHQVRRIDRRQVNGRQSFRGSVLCVRVPQSLITCQLGLLVSTILLAFYVDGFVAVFSFSVFGVLTDLGKRSALLFFHRLGGPAGERRRSLRNS